MTGLKSFHRKTQLGKLCKNNHEYLNTGKSLRYKSNNCCIICVREGYKRYINNQKKALNG
jgi:hypothetical protein